MEVLEVDAIARRPVSSEVLNRLGSSSVAAVIDPNLIDASEQAISKSELTSREIEILELASCGFSSKEIAESLYLAYSTIKNHKHNALKKLGAFNMAHAVRLSFENGILDLSTNYPNGQALVLSPGEAKELFLASHGFMASESAAERNLSVNTTKNHRLFILDKLGAQNMPQAIRIGFELGLLTPEPQVG